MTVKDAYNYGVYFLSCNGVDEAEFKSLCLVCSLAGIKNSQYQQHLDDEIIMKRFADLLWRVKSGEPLQYVLGKWDFYESEFYCGKGVLIPRPETEELCDMAIKYIKTLPDCVVYDLCAGTGCIGISIAKKCKNATVYLVEKSSDAMAYLLKNAHGVENAKVICADICNNVELEKADVLVSNPPYIKTDDIKTLQNEVLYEPVTALDGGADGLDFYRVINDNWHNKVKPNAKLFLEIGNEQGSAVSEILTDFTDIKVHKDIYGNDRIVTCMKGNCL